MVLAVKLADTRGRRLAIIAEFVSLFLLGVTSLDEVVPLFQAPQRAKLIRQCWFHRVHGCVLLRCLPSIHRVVRVSSATEVPPPRVFWGKRLQAIENKEREAEKESKKGPKRLQV